MTDDPTMRVAAKLQAVYDGADDEERAVLDEFGAMLRGISEAAEGDGGAADEVEGFGLPTAKRVSNGKSGQASGGRDLANQNKLGNFEIQGLMSKFNEVPSLTHVLGGRWPPR